MFLGDRRELIERVILAATAEERDDAEAALLPLQRQDFTELLDAMDGLPVNIRLLDPPLHEFLPDRTELAVKVALAEASGETGEQVDADRKLLAAVERLHESNPMLGLRGVRLGLLTPGLYALQVRAIGEAASDQIAAGKDPKVEIMVPLVGSVMELHLVRDETEQILADVAAEKGVTLTIPIGTMIELPRAALTAHRIADAADFFSFGTNDLTQTTWGFSRDDVESTVFAAYLDKGVFTISPFETIDGDGVGRLVQIAAEEGRKTKPGLKLGVCGEHGGDPESIHFFHQTGLDYVSCSPFRIPVARLEAGRAAVGEPNREGFPTAGLGRVSLLDARHQSGAAVSASALLDVVAAGNHELWWLGVRRDVLPGRDVVLEHASAAALKGVRCDYGVNVTLNAGHGENIAVSAVGGSV